jgi:hypothetical protein
VSVETLLPRGVRGWLTEEEAAELTRLAAGKIVLEIGSYCGLSTIVMARVAARVFALDWHRGDADAGFGNTLVEFYGNLYGHDLADKVAVLVGRTAELAPALGDAWADMAFVDGAHDYTSVVTDLCLARRCLKPGGMIAMHDFGREQVENAALRVFPREFSQVARVGSLGVFAVAGGGEKLVGITEEVLKSELASLAAQRETTLAQKREAESTLARIDGCEMMVRHLLGKLTAPAPVILGEGEELASGLALRRGSAPASVAPVEANGPCGGKPIG